MQMRLLAFLGAAALALPLLSAHAEQEPVALERAGGEELATAVGHYARARSLLIAALHEFDAGAKLADPKVLLDKKQWRNTLIDRAEDLERVLDPQPRASRTGVKFNADSRLLAESKPEAKE